jgi:putative Mg2+ transporter-C (MgtC) family protein
MSAIDAANLSELEVVGRLAVALAAGGALGLEREIHGHEAGFRTHALLALGAGVFGVMSVGAFGDFVSVRAASNVQVDVTRIASYVAAGVGFIAGGAIVKDSNRVKGLTTAASLWVCAGVGLAAGLGFFVAAIAGTVLALFMLFLDRPVSFLRRHARKGILHVTLRDENGLGELMAALLLDDDDPRTSSDVSVQRESDGRVEVEVLKLSKPVGARLLARTSSLPSVVEATFSSG